MNRALNVQSHIDPGTGTHVRSVMQRRSDGTGGFKQDLDPAPLRAGGRGARHDGLRGRVARAKQHWDASAGWCGIACQRMVGFKTSDKAL